MCASGQRDPDPEEPSDLFEVPDMAELFRIWSVPPADFSGAGRPVTDFGTAFRVGLGLALALLDDSDPSGRQVLVRLESATARWAREQVPIEVIQHAVHEGVKNGLGLHDRHRYREADRGTDGVDGAFLVDVLDTLTATVSRAYVAQLRDGQEPR